jgi:hypothetical protein
MTDNKDNNDQNKKISMLDLVSDFQKEIKAKEWVENMDKAHGQALKENERRVKEANEAALEVRAEEYATEFYDELEQNYKDLRSGDLMNTLQALLDSSDGELCAELSITRSYKDGFIEGYKDYARNQADYDFDATEAYIGKPEARVKVTLGMTDNLRKDVYHRLPEIADSVVDFYKNHSLNSNDTDDMFNDTKNILREHFDIKYLMPKSVFRGDRMDKIIASISDIGSRKDRISFEIGADDTMKIISSDMLAHSKHDDQDLFDSGDLLKVVESCFAGNSYGDKSYSSYAGPVNMLAFNELLAKFLARNLESEAVATLNENILQSDNSDLFLYDEKNRAEDTRNIDAHLHKIVRDIKEEQVLRAEARAQREKEFRRNNWGRPGLVNINDGLSGPEKY